MPRGRTIVVDGLAFGVLPEAATALRESHSLVALVHHPLALESGLSEDESASLQASERRRARRCAPRHHASRATARVLQPTMASRTIG